MTNNLTNPNNRNQKRKEVDTSFEIINRCLIIHLNQELDHHCAVKIREKSDKLIDKENIRNIIFDFENTAFMDSSGIGVIMGRYKRVIFMGGKVAVVGVSNSIDRILHLSGLYKIIDKYENVTDAAKVL
jgi:anti-sigma F factor antagonist